MCKEEEPFEVASAAFHDMLEDELQKLADLIAKKSGVECETMNHIGGTGMQINMYKKDGVSKEMYDVQVEVAAFVFDKAVAQRKRICELKGKLILAEILAEPDGYKFGDVWRMAHTKDLYLLDYEWVNESVEPLQV